jgi:hypothetical protein
MNNNRNMDILSPSTKEELQTTVTSRLDTKQVGAEIQLLEVALATDHSHSQSQT